MTETSVYVQDQWRVARGLTLNGGLRYQLQLPAVATIPGYSVRNVRRSVRRLGHRHWNRGSRVQPVHAWDAHGIENAVHGARARREALQDRLEQPSAERRSGLAADGTVGILAEAVGRSGTSDDPRGLLDCLQPRRDGHVPHEPVTEPGTHDQREPERRQRQPGLSRPAVAPALSRDSSARSAGRVHRGRDRRLHGHDARLPDCRDHRDQPAHLRSRPPARLLAAVLGRLPAAVVQRHGGRAPLRAHAEHRHVGHRELERDQHHRERLPQRVQGRPGQPLREHRRGAWTDLRIHGPRHGHVAPADLRRALQRGAGRTGGRRLEVHGHELDQQHVHGLPEPPQPQRPAGSPRPTRRPASTATRRSATTVSRRGCP